MNTTKTFIARAYADGYEPSMPVSASYEVIPGTRYAQIDEDGNAFGLWGIWNIYSGWWYFPPTVFPPENFSDQILSDQGYKKNTKQKYNRWLKNENEASPIIPNWTDISTDLNTTSVLAHFKTAHNATIEVELLEGNIKGGANDLIDFKDPWFIDDFSNTQKGPRNRGVSAIWHTKTSGFHPNTDSTGDGSEYKGVFLDQRSDIPGNPYYSVRVPQTQTIGNIDSCNFLGWSVTGTSQVVNPTSLESPVIFKGANDTVKARYKGHLASSNSNVL